MEPNQFDSLTRSVASGLSRRRALTRFGGGGAAALLAAAGLQRLAPAQAAAACTLNFTGTVRVGPSATQPITTGGQPGVLQGQLTFTADHQGAIGQGQIALSGGPTVPVVGQITGRAINLRMAVNDQLVIVAVGTAAQDLTTCQGKVDGLLTGPQQGDLGDWHATAASASTPSSGTTSGGTTSGGAAVTQVPGAPSSTQPPSTQSTATATSCPSGQTSCDGVCVDLNTDPAHCGDCRFPCPADVGTCIGGRCAPSTAPVTAPPSTTCSSGLTSCGGQCVNLNADRNNCGSCGHVCDATFPCIGGSCVCPPALSVCSGKCTDTTSDPANCGSCGNACSSGQSCTGSVCG